MDIGVAAELLQLWYGGHVATIRRNVRSRGSNKIILQWHECFDMPLIPRHKPPCGADSCSRRCVTRIFSVGLCRRLAFGGRFQFESLWVHSFVRHTVFVCVALFFYMSHQEGGLAVLVVVSSLANKHEHERDEHNCQRGVVRCTAPKLGHHFQRVIELVLGRETAGVAYAPVERCVSFLNGELSRQVPDAVDCLRRQL